MPVFQAAQGSYLYSDCGCCPPPPVCPCPPPPVCDPPKPAFEVGCCPGPVVEKKFVTQKPVSVPFSFSVPTFSKKCFTQPGGVDRKVIPTAFETAPICETQRTVIKVPTTDVEVKQQPLCKKTCTTSEYIIQIPIVETTCTSTPLCKKTIKTQENLLTTTASKVACDKQVCTQKKVIDTPLTQTVCQDFQGSVCKTGAKTVLQPEIKKTCVQLPPYKCLKPVTDSPIFPPFLPGYGAPFPVDAPLFSSPAVFPKPLYGGGVFAPSYGPEFANGYGPEFFTPNYGPEVLAPGYGAPGYGAPFFSSPAVFPGAAPSTCPCCP